MATRQYIGARYVPIIDGEWDNSKAYDPLVIVTHEGNSYTSRTYVPVGIDISNTIYWTLTGNYNAQVEAYRQEVEALSDDVSSFIIDFNKKVSEVNKRIPCHLLLDGNFDMTYNLNGAAYVGFNKIVAYFAKTNVDDDTGKLRCFNLSTHSMEWEHDIEAYHGNSIVYRAIDNCLYICGCIASPDRSPINKIIVVSMAAPSVIKEVIDAPVTIGSIAYDSVSDTFYGSGNVANTLYKFDGLFESVAETITVDYDQFDDNEIYFDRLSLIHDGVIYGYCYTMPNNPTRYNGIVGYTPEGEFVYSAEVPSIIHGFRGIGEIENIIYDFDNDRFIIGSSNSWSGVDGKSIVSFFESGMFKNVIEVTPYGNIYDARSTSDSKIIISVANGTDELRPFMEFASTYVKCFSDALNIAATYRREIEVQISTNHNGELTIGNTILQNCKMRILPSDAANTVTFNKVIDKGNNIIKFEHCLFNVANKIDSVTEALLTVASSSKFIFADSEFADYVDDTSLTYHYSLLINSGTEVEVDDITNLGSKSRLILDGARLLTPESSKWTTITGSTTSASADYSESNITFTVPARRRYACSVNVGYSNVTPLGVAITKSTSVSVSYADAIFESPSGILCKNTPVFVLPPGTYKIWTKHGSAPSSGETVTLIYKDVTH